MESTLNSYRYLVCLSTAQRCLLIISLAFTAPNATHAAETLKPAYVCTEVSGRKVFATVEDLPSVTNGSCVEIEFKERAQTAVHRCVPLSGGTPIYLSQARLELKDMKCTRIEK